jgi:serine/threonine-protein kinase
MPPPDPTLFQSTLDLEHLLYDFDQAWRAGQQPSIDEFLPPANGLTPVTRRQALEELIKLDLECMWRRNSKAGSRVEDYVKRYPELAPAGLDLISEEYRVRQRWGDHPGAEEYAKRFPQHGARLAQRLAQIDSELAVEYVQRRPGATPPTINKPDPLEPAAPAQPITTVAGLVEELTQRPLLTTAQRDELAKLRSRFTDPRAMARELLQRGWLTPYQVNQLLQGRGNDLVLGQYILLERLGEGGTGQVFKGRHQGMSRVVAVKIIRRELLSDTEVLRRFYREIEVIGKMSHPNVIHAYDAGPIQQAHVLIMEFVEGTDLAALVKRSGPLDVWQACDYIYQAAAGLQHIHAHGLAHRDIKPSNLFLVTGKNPSNNSAEDASDKTTALSPSGIPGCIKILDLGLARLQPTTINGEITGLLTPVGSLMMGTPDFLAPEQALDFHAADIRADIYSLGCTLFYLLTGKPPFPGGNLAQKLVKHQQMPLPPLDGFRNDVPAELVRVLNKMVAKQPGDRYQTPDALAADLAELLRQQDRSVPLTPRPRRMLARVGAAAVTMLLIVGIVSTLALRSKKTTSQEGRRQEISQSDADNSAARAETWEELKKLWGDPAATNADKRRAVLDFRTRYSGTSAALDAVRLQQKLRSPLDGLPQEKVADATVSEGGKTRELMAWTFDSPFTPTTIAISPDDRYLAILGAERLQVRDLATGKDLDNPWDLKVVEGVVFSPDGKLLAVGGPKAVKLVDLASEKAVKTISRAGGKIQYFAWSPRGDKIAAAIGDRMVRIFDLAADKDYALTTPHQSAVQSLAFSPDGKTLFSSANSLSIGQDLATQNVLFTLKQGRGKVSPAYSPDGRMLATVENWTKNIELRDPATGQPLPTKLSGFGHTGNNLAIAFSPDASTLVSIDRVRELVIWNTTTCKPEQHWQLPGQGATHPVVVFNGDGRFIAVLANTKGTIYIARLAQRGS